MLTMNLNENIKIKKGKYTPYILFWSRTWHKDTKCNCERDGLWVRFPLEEMVSRQSAVHCSVWYLIRFYLITIRPGRKRKLGTVIYYYYILVTTCALFSLTKKKLHFASRIQQHRQTEICPRFPLPSVKTICCHQHTSVSLQYWPQKKIHFIHPKNNTSLINTTISLRKRQTHIKLPEQIAVMTRTIQDTNNGTARV